MAISFFVFLFITAYGAQAECAIRQSIVAFAAQSAWKLASLPRPPYRSSRSRCVGVAKLYSMPPKAKKPAKVGLADLIISNAGSCGACSPFEVNYVVQEGKEKKGKKDPPAAAAMDVVSVDELNQKIATLEKEKNKEEEYRNYMQLERVSCIPEDFHLTRVFVFFLYTACSPLSHLHFGHQDNIAGATLGHTSHSKLVLLSLVFWDSIRSPLICLHSGLLANPKPCLLSALLCLLVRSQNAFIHAGAYMLNTRKRLMQFLTS